MNEEKKQQVIALGRLGWSLRRIERRTGVRRETAATYLKAAGVPLRPPGGWGRQDPKPAIEVITDSASSQAPGTPVEDAAWVKPANEVTTDFGAEFDGAGIGEPKLGRSPSASACEPYREVIAIFIIVLRDYCGKVWIVIQAAAHHSSNQIAIVVI